MPLSTEKNNDQIISYFALRSIIGALGITLPILLVVVNYFCNSSFLIEDSISDYYDNNTAGDVLVGVLFVLGFFLLAYKGFNKLDSTTANIGGVAALGIALFPTTSSISFVHYTHYFFAFILFSVFIFFALFLFRKTHKNGAQTVKKIYRNRVYLTCGIIMSICVVGIGVTSFLKSFDDFKTQYNTTFWFETIALISFGFSWIVKGEMLLADNEK
jgi:ABC-type Fe3+-siderophore transport system permease subunit